MITSTSNTQIKNIRKLSQKKYRRESGTFLVEGLRQVISADEQQARFKKLVYCDELLVSQRGREFLLSAQNLDIPVLEVNQDVFRSISSKDGPQGLCAVVEQNLKSLDGISILSGLWVGLDEIQDPGNLGTILRTLDAVGGKGVVLIGDTTDVYHPNSVRASMGAVFSLELITTDQDSFISYMKNKEIDIIGAVCESVQDYRSYNYAETMFLLMGSEQKGLQAKMKDVCSALVTIPMIGSVDSLNLANATSILLYEIFRRHNPAEQKI